MKHLLMQTAEQWPFQIAGGLAASQLVEEAANLTYPYPPAKTETRVVGA